jgi:WD40 repeat protein
MIFVWIAMPELSSVSVGWQESPREGIAGSDCRAPRPAELQSSQPEWSAVRIPFPIDGEAGRSRTAYAIRILRKEGLILAVGNGSVIRVWNVESGKTWNLSLSKRDDRTIAAWHLNFSPDGSLLVVCSDYGVPVFDVKTGRLRAWLPKFFSPGRSAFALDGTKLAIGGSAGNFMAWYDANHYPSTIAVWDVSQINERTDMRMMDSREREENRGRIVDTLGDHLGFSANGRYLAAGGSDLSNHWRTQVRTGKWIWLPDSECYDGFKRACVWEVESGRFVREFRFQCGDRQLKFVRVLGTMNALITGIESTVEFWDIPSGQKQRSISLRDGPITDAEVFPDERRLVLGSQRGPITILDARTGGLVSRFEQPKTAVKAVAVSCDGTQMAAVEEGGTVHTWVLRAGPATRTR